MPTYETNPKVLLHRACVVEARKALSPRPDGVSRKELKAMTLKLAKQMFAVRKKALYPRRRSRLQ